MQEDSFLLYGAYGYTGTLIAELATTFKLRPILAGRNEARLVRMSAETGFEYRAFDLDQPALIDAALSDVTVVIHAAGPFAHTAEPMMDACIRNTVHYLDITGEIDVFELGHKKSAAAMQANIMLMPGTGFDVVPTDCLALYLKEFLPDATQLKLAFVNQGGGVSQGTAKTMVESMGQAGAERIAGVIESVPIGAHHMNIMHEGKSIFVMSIPWGDVSTAFYSTGIPNIITYTGISPKAFRYIRLHKYAKGILGMGWVQALLKRRIDKQAPGPSASIREKAFSLVWGEVQNEQGEKMRARLITPEGYTLTAFMSLNIARKIISGDVKPGFQTPSSAYGADLVLEMEGVVRTQLP